MSLSEHSVMKREFSRHRSVPCKFMSDVEYSVMKSDIIKSLTVVIHVHVYNPRDFLTFLRSGPGA